MSTTGERDEKNTAAPEARIAARIRSTAKKSGAGARGAGKSASEKKLRLAILWHQHQPYYKAGEKFILPWVWLHATKDYLEMLEHVERVPGVKATFNLVPSLVKQIEEYLSGTADPFIDLMHISVKDYTSSERESLIHGCFHANPATMISRSPRYLELYERYQRDGAVAFGDVETIDLTVHFMLAWLGEFARCEEPAHGLIQKERDYSEEEKRALYAQCRSVVGEVLSRHRALRDKGQIELSTSPFYHPILPLLIDHTAARDAMEHVTLPHKNFQRPEDAELQLKRSKEHAQSTLGKAPRGLWPSEGSVSEAALAIAAKYFDWAGADEGVLWNSLERIGRQETVEDQPGLAKYFPRRMRFGDDEIVLFFRDHALSDKIGFTYQTWHPDDAVSDFLSELERIRTTILETAGGEALERACVSVILDGENCWEYYPENGRLFLEKLYSALGSSNHVETVTFSEALDAVGEKIPALTGLVAGSWINSNFSIWIGHPEDNIAWDMLADARAKLAQYRINLERTTGPAREEAERRYALAYEEILIAEGSDWCWWYGDDHFSTQKDKFDELYRMHLRAAYVHLDERVPSALLRPIPQLARGSTQTAVPIDHASREEPSVNGERQSVAWTGITRVELPRAFGAMHRSSSLGLDELKVARIKENLFLRIAPKGVDASECSITIHVKEPSLTLQFDRESFTMRHPSIAQGSRGIRFCVGETLDVALPASHFTGSMLEVGLELVHNDRSARIPEDGFMRIDI